MPRRLTISQSDFPYHVYARCINRDWFELPTQVVWELMCEQLYFVHHAFGLRVLSFVLMSNHFHLITRTPNANLSEAMSWFMRETSRSLTKAGNRINQTYGGRFGRSIIKSHHYYLNAYKYIYYNPVKAGVCRSVVDYPFSTLHGLIGKSRLLIPVEEDTTLFSDFEGTLRWLDRPPNEENWESVRAAMRKSEFKLARANARPHSLENDAL